MKRIISLILAVIMVATVLPVIVLANSMNEGEIERIDELGYLDARLLDSGNITISIAQCVGHQRIAVFWTAIPNAIAYKVYFAEWGSNTYKAKATVTTNNCVVSGLELGRYKIRVKAYVDGAWTELADCPYVIATSEAYYGTCGDNLEWSRSTDGKELIISGIGDMYNYDPILDAFETCAPWGFYDITSVIIENGVTSIGDYAFYETDIASVTISDTVTRIGFAAFADCYNLTTVTIPDGVTRIEDYAFSTAYTDLTLNLDLSITRDNFSDIQWSDSYFDYDDTIYNHHLARVAAALSASAYNQSNVANDLQFLGFTDIEQTYVKPTSNNYNTVSFSIAQKTAWTSTGAKPVIAIVIKGTGTDKEWYSNFDIGMGSTHYGFDEAKEKVMAAIDEYIDTVIESWVEPFQASQIKFMVTGHSRGAAVANLVAADLTENYEHDGVYAYTFASPTVSTKATSDGFDNIFNIVNREDFVTRIPLAEWGFARYGLDLVLPSKSHRTFEYSTFSYAYELITGEEYHGYNGTQEVDTLCSQVGNLVEDAGLYSTQTFVGFFTTMTLKEYFMEVAALLAKEVDIGGFGSKAVGDFWFITEFLVKNYANGSIMGVHDYNAYFTWMAAFSCEDLFGRNGSVIGETAYYCKRLTVKCPVDVFVYDKSGVLVASVVNNVVVCDTLAVGVYGDEKIIDLPGDQEYRVEVIATDDGVVNYKVEEISIEGADATTVRTIRFDDIEISVNDTLTGSISEEQHNPVDEYQLIQNGTIVVNVDFDSDTASDSCNGNHFYGELTEYSDSEHRRICSSCNYAEYTIHNWDWENGVTNADTTVTYSCPDCQATMVREVNNFVLGELNDDGSVDKNDAIYLLYSVLFGESQYPLNQTCDFNADGSVDKNDAIYLLYHALFGEENYPLN